MAEPPAQRRRSTKPRSQPSATRSSDGRRELDPQWLAEVAELSFQEARTALDLVMAQLQSDGLEVEEMAGLYRRAVAYADRCESVLHRVEQDVIEWDADIPPTTP